ncbi:SNF2 family domain-containing protein [Colletotrichum abscissum]|uniref:SNF2 family domain-containing protein n=1 Tax=Colletotrichum abscissum TaxID=1671311 RepID=A0A9Q0B382_9PEZI|nr:SNF2 family domain-containing protein [Colletotrichum abscissum]KAI3553295.1 SNF2 family domain-containing protein [Colletotrichum abscissum]KAK1499804.1 SNF2 family domain-containing protein [Colletotrichum abscissum]
MSSSHSGNNRIKPRCGFELEDDSEEEGNSYPSSKYPASSRNEEPNIFDDSIEDMIRESRDDVGASAINATPSQYGNQDLDDLFVADDSAQEADFPQDEVISIKSEDSSDDDCDFMAIQKTEASTRAQDKWSLPSRTPPIDLTQDVKDEPDMQETDSAFGKVETSKAENRSPTIVRGKQHTSSRPNDESPDPNHLQVRKAELLMKGQEGGLSSEEVAELCRLEMAIITSQGAANEDQDKYASKGGVENDKKHREANAREKKNKSKRKNPEVQRNGPPKNAAEYFARKGQELREKKQKELEKQSSTDPTRHRKKAKLSAKALKDEEERRDRVATIFQPNDAIHERAGMGDSRPEPVFMARTKKDQFEQIKAAIPEGCDLRRTKSQQNDTEDASEAWGFNNCKAVDNKWKIKGMKTAIHHHQLTAAAWMLQRELMPGWDRLPQGGILADAMGMGKTIVTLSCMVGNQPNDLLVSKGRGATLVVCNNGHTIDQWMNEVKTHCEGKFSTRIVHYSSSHKMDVKLLESFNIVFASYRQISNSAPTVEEIELKGKELKGDKKAFKKWLREEKGDLLKIKWHRVVLDEAQQIKNHETQSMNACLLIDARYRWALSGTPLSNRNYELYPYLKFIGCEVGSFKEFEIKFGKGSKAEANLDHLISAVAYRRTQADTFLGRPIINLPLTHPTHQYLRMSKEEIVIFSMAEECFRRKMMEDMEAPGAGPSRKTCFEMLLRLRQAATHPFLLEAMMRKHMTLDDIRKVRKRLADLRGGPSIYDQIGSWTKRHEMSGERLQQIMNSVGEKVRQHNFDDSQQNEADSEENAASPESGATLQFDNSISENDDETTIEGEFDSELDEVDSQDEVEDLSYRKLLELDAEASVMEESEQSHAFIPGDAPLKPFGQSNFGLHFDMDKHMEYLEKFELLKLAVCPVCKETPTVPVKGNCEHSFCNQCALDHLTTAGKICPGCKKIIGKMRPTNILHGQSEGNEVRGNDYYGYQQTFDNRQMTSHFLEISDSMPDVPVTPSAKMTACKETILRWQAEAPNDKIIVFTQFVLVGKILGRMLEAEDIPFVYLTGKQTKDQRVRAVKGFQENEEIKVLVASLRAGGQALNLTRANRVILMELWWNHAQEQQAYARVFRYGQDKETHFARFIVQTPIEDRILRMQADKIVEIDRALQDDGHVIKGLSVHEIMQLMGRVRVKDDRAVVEPDYEDYEDYLQEIISNPDDRNLEEEEEDLEGFVVPDDAAEEASEEETDDSTPTIVLSDDSEEE